MRKVVLIIIYNHKYDKNIEILEALYQHRFSHIYHLVPFYTGDRKNVIPVYENSHYFQGYISQGLKAFFDESAAHYFFIGDDLLLNPIINETNYQEHFKVDQHSCFLPGFINLHECDYAWPRIAEAYHYKPIHTGIEINKELPDFNQASKAFERHKLPLAALDFKQIFGEQKRPSWSHPKKMLGYLKRKWKNRKKTQVKYYLSYPLVGSYADIFLVSSHNIKQFCHYCGLFAATKLFVELAVPTAMVLSAEKIVTEKDLDLKGKALWTEHDLGILDKYNYQLSSLLNDFPAQHLYLHPVKLSKWK